jgi:hypothetical protein
LMSKCERSAWSAKAQVQGSIYLLCCTLGRESVRTL